VPLFLKDQVDIFLDSPFDVLEKKMREKEAAQAAEEKEKRGFGVEIKLTMKVGDRFWKAVQTGHLRIGENNWTVIGTNPLSGMLWLGR
jgi:hypothetical protein